MNHVNKLGEEWMGGIGCLDYTLVVGMCCDFGRDTVSDAHTWMTPPRHHHVWQLPDDSCQAILTAVASLPKTRQYADMPDNASVIWQRALERAHREILHGISGASHPAARTCDE